MTDLPAGAFTEYLGLEITEVTPDKVSCTWLAGEKHHQPMGLVHGGVHASVVETLGSIAAWSWRQDQGHEGGVVGVNNNTDFFRPVSHGQMVSVATPIHRGRTQQVWLIETHDDQGKLVSRGQLRVHNL